MNKVKRFKYEKPNGDTSNRVLWVMGKPSDCFFGLDLSQFVEGDQEYYIQELEHIFSIMEESIDELGLNTCYRNFKEYRIINE